MKIKTGAFLLAMSVSLGMGCYCNAGNFDVPDFTELPPDVNVLSEKVDDGVKITEFFMSGAPFNGKPTKIYAFYCRPEKDGKYPGVVEIHGAGLRSKIENGREMGGIKPGAGIEYAKNGFCCIVIEWAGVRSVCNSVGNMARLLPEDEKAKAPPYGWKTFGPEVDGIRNGVMFARRAAMFLKSRPEVDAEKLCVSGMSAGAHLTLLLLGVEPSFKAAAVKYGRAFIDMPGCFGGYFGPLYLCGKKDQDAWLEVMDPKHGISQYKADVLMLSGTDDIFFWMPGVLATYRAIPTEKRLLMFPNENHGYVGNVPIPLSWFKSVLGMAPAWPVVEAPKAAVEGDTLKLAVKVSGAAKASFWVKRMPKGKFRWVGEKGKPETFVKWTEVPAALADGVWSASIPAPAPDEQLVAYAMVEDANGIKDSSDTVEIPDYPQWRSVNASKK